MFWGLTALTTPGPCFSSLNRLTKSTLRSNPGQAPRSHTETHGRPGRGAKTLIWPCFMASKDARGIASMESAAGFWEDGTSRKLPRGESCWPSRSDLPPIAPPQWLRGAEGRENFDVDLQDALAHTTVSADEFLRVLNDLTAVGLPDSLLRKPGPSPGDRKWAIKELFRPWPANGGVARRG